MEYMVELGDMVKIIRLNYPYLHWNKEVILIVLLS